MSQINSSIFKYIIIQIVYAAGIILLIFFFSETQNKYIFILFFFFFLMKTRRFPRYLWVPEIFSNLSFIEIFFLGTFTKIPPFIILYYIRLCNDNLLFFCILITIYISVVSGIKSSNIRVLIAFSSILNIR